MKKIILGLLAMGFSAWMAAGVASSDDPASPLENDRIQIRSMLDPSVTILKTQPVSIALPANPTIGDKQLLELIKNNMIVQGYTVTGPDKSLWTITATVKDQTTTMTYSKMSGFLFPSTSTSASTISYATITMVICAASDLSTPVWTSTVLTNSDFWIKNQEDIVKAILATYGIDFYYRNEEPKDVADDAKDRKHQPTVPTLEDLKHCIANPKADGC